MLILSMCFFCKVHKKTLLPLFLVGEFFYCIYNMHLFLFVFTILFTFIFRNFTKKDT